MNPNNRNGDDFYFKQGELEGLNPFLIIIIIIMRKNYHFSLIYN